jgi:hypothetical protein
MFLHAPGVHEPECNSNTQNAANTDLSRSVVICVWSKDYPEFALSVWKIRKKYKLSKID